MENSQLTPGVEKTPEQIEQEMAQTRESLTGKVAALENQVVGTVQTAADTLNGTVEAVKSFVSAAPDTVKQAADVVGEKVREIFDISGHVRNHPWASVGTSALIGCITGWLLFRERGSRVSAPAGAMPAYTPPPPAAPSPPGVFDELVAMVGRKIREVAETAIDTAGNAVNQTVREEVPKLVDSAAERLTPGTA